MPCFMSVLKLVGDSIEDFDTFREGGRMDFLRLTHGECVNTPWLIRSAERFRLFLFEIVLPIIIPLVVGVFQDHYPSSKRRTRSGLGPKCSGPPPLSDTELHKFNSVSECVGFQFLGLVH